MIAIEFQTGTEKVLFRSSDYSGYEICWQRIQKNERVWTPEKYFASIEHGLQYITELKIRSSDIHTLAELNRAIAKARAEIVEVWQIKRDTAG